MKVADASKRFISCSLRELREGEDVTCPILGVSKIACYGVSGVCDLKTRFHWWIRVSFRELKKVEINQKWHLVVLIGEFKDAESIK